MTHIWVVRRQTVNKVLTYRPATSFQLGQVGIGLC